jgi:hypothetical protein
MVKIDRIQQLHDKFFHGTITEEERQELYNHFKDQVCLDGKIHRDLLDRFLFVTHPDYGKPDKKGRVIII